MSITLVLLLTASAPLFALFARGRRALFQCALIFAADELFYLSAWSPHSPHHLLQCIGVEIPSSELWAVGDCVAGLAIVMTLMDADRMRLAVIFLNLYLGQIACYIAMRGLPPEDPGDPLWMLLDYCFYAMIAIFAVLGGGGIVDLVIRFSARRRRAVSRRAPAFPTTRRKVDAAEEALK